jgi:hypothetical protein
VRDRRAKIRTHVQRQLEAVASELSTAKSVEIELALTQLYVEEPVRWQAFLDQASTLIGRLGRENSGFSETVQTLD